MNIEGLKLLPTFIEYVKAMGDDIAAVAEAVKDDKKSASFVNDAAVLQKAAFAKLQGKEVAPEIKPGEAYRRLMDAAGREDAMGLGPMAPQKNMHQMPTGMEVGKFAAIVLDMYDMSQKITDAKGQRNELASLMFKANAAYLAKRADYLDSYNDGARPLDTVVKPVGDYLDGKHISVPQLVGSIVGLYNHMEWMVSYGDYNKTGFGVNDASDYLDTLVMPPAIRICEEKLRPLADFAPLKPKNRPSVFAVETSTFV